MKQIILIAITLFTFSQINAQIKAKTESGNTVILYKNGTWEYYEAGAEIKQPEKTAPAVIPAAVAATAIVIDKTATKSSERIELFNCVSPKLSKYFGEEKGKIRCYSSLSNDKGVLTIRFELNAPVGDGYRYFGRSLEERSITLILDDDKEINIPIDQQIEEKFIDKWNQSYFIGAGTLSEDELNAIYHSSLYKIKVDWKKNPEVYDVENKKLLQETLKEVL